MDFKNLTVDHLRSLVSYDQNSGAFRWSTPRPKINVGEIAGTLCNKGYRIIKLNGKSYKSHRLAWLYVTGAWPKDQIDHKNRDRSDNRFANLRESDNASNCQNQGIRANNKSGFKGVHAQNGKWYASICVRMKRIHLGSFNTPEEAGAVYLKAQMNFHPTRPR